jgi:hypothetical protein
LQAQRNGSHGHHLTPLEIDIANNNTYNHLPTPKGSWKELNDKRQQVNNMTLIVGFGIFISALFGVNLILLRNFIFSFYSVLFDSSK